MALCAKEHYSKRELERQIDSAYYERYMLSAKKLMPESVPQDVRGSILDTYVLEFLDLPEQFSERNLRKAITDNLKQFILEFGKDFTFICEEYLFRWADRISILTFCSITERCPALFRSS